MNIVLDGSIVNIEMYAQEIGAGMDTDYANTFKEQLDLIDITVAEASALIRTYLENNFPFDRFSDSFFYSTKFTFSTNETKGRKEANPEFQFLSHVPIKVIKENIVLAIREGSIDK